LRRLITAGWVVFAGDDRPVVLLTATGIAVMEGRAPARVILPDRSVSKEGRKRARGSAGLPARAVPSIRASGSGPQVVREDDPLADEATRALFEALRAYRLTIAKSESLPPYGIASDRTLRDIARLRPKTTEELLEAHGMGPTKAAKYGEGILSIVQQR